MTGQPQILLCISRSPGRVFRSSERSWWNSAWDLDFSRRRSRRRRREGAGASGWQMCDAGSDDLRVPRKRSPAVQHIPNPLGIKRSSGQRIISSQSKHSTWFPCQAPSKVCCLGPKSHWNGMVFNQNVWQISLLCFGNKHHHPATEQNPLVIKSVWCIIF